MAFEPQVREATYWVTMARRTPRFRDFARYCVPSLPFALGTLFFPAPKPRRSALPDINYCELTATARLTAPRHRHEVDEFFDAPYAGF